MKLFGLPQTREFAAILAARLGTEPAPLEERSFEDGEFKIRPLVDVRGEHVLVCQSLSGDARMGINDKLMRLLVFCGAIEDASAAEVTAVVPYLAYWRKDRRTKSRDPVTTSYIARLLEAVGVDRVVTMDPHGDASFDNAFRCRKEASSALPLFVDHFAERAGAAARVVVLAPDSGAVARARAFAAALGKRIEREVGTAFMEKERSEGKVSGEHFAGDVRGALVIVFDDMISTGGTILRAARAAAARGAGSVHAAATHGVFSADAAQTLGSAGLASLVVTNTVPDAAARVPALSVAVLDATEPLARDLAWAAD